MDYDQGVVHRRRIISPPDSFFVNTGGSSGGGGGGAVTLNPSDKSTHAALSPDNLTLTSSGGQAAVRSTTSHSTGKYYFTVGTFVATSNYSHGVGIAPAAKNLEDLATLTGHAVQYNGDTKVYVNGTNNDITNSYNAPHSYEVCIDIDNKRWWSREIGVSAGWNGSGANDPTVPSSGVDLSIIPTPWFVLGYCNNAGDGEASQTYDFTTLTGAPSGFVAW